MTADFEVQGHWGKNSTQLGYSFAYQAGTNTMVSTGWGEPNAPKQSEGDAAPDRYGRSIWLWDLEKKEVLKAVVSWLVSRSAATMLLITCCIRTSVTME